MFEVSFCSNTGELACVDATTLLASLRSQIMLDTIVVKFRLRVLVSVCTLLAISLFRSLNISTFIRRLMSFTIVRSSALDMLLE